MCRSGQRLDGKVAIVTGSSSGIGLAAAKNLAGRGAKVILASHNTTKLLRAQQEIIEDSGNNNVSYKVLDLSSLKSVRNFANDVIHSENHLDIFISNAGSLTMPDRLSEDGLNLTMQVNYFGSFLLLYLLLPLIKASGPSRIVKEQGSAMYVGHIDFDHWNDIDQSRVIDVANSKLAGALFMAELNKRLAGSRVTINSYDPFVVAGTDILNDAPQPLKMIAQKFVTLIGQSKEEVGNQIAYLASDPLMSNVSGQHYVFCHRFMNHWLTKDAQLTKRVWDTSKKLVGITPEEDWELQIG